MIVYLLLPGWPSNFLDSSYRILTCIPLPNVRYDRILARWDRGPGLPRRNRLMTRDCVIRAIG